MDDCLFCKIAAGQIPSNKLYEDDTLLAFYDIDPQAPVHFLVIPKQHIESAAKLTEADAALLGHIYATIANLCKQLGVDESGYRVVTNVGADGALKREAPALPCAGKAQPCMASGLMQAPLHRNVKRGCLLWQKPIPCMWQA